MFINYNNNNNNADDDADDMTVKAQKHTEILYKI